MRFVQGAGLADLAVSAPSVALLAEHFIALWMVYKRKEKFRKSDPGTPAFLFALFAYVARLCVRRVSRALQR